MPIDGESETNVATPPGFTVSGVLEESFRIFSMKPCFFIGFGVVVFCSTSLVHELTEIIHQNHSIRLSAMFLPLRLAMRFLLVSIPSVIQAIIAVKVMSGFNGASDSNVGRKTVFYPFAIAKQAIAPIIIAFLLDLLFDEVRTFAGGLDMKYRTVLYFAGKSGGNIAFACFRHGVGYIWMVIAHMPLFGAIAAVDGRLRFDAIIPYCIKLLRGNCAAFFTLVFVRVFFFVVVDMMFPLAWMFSLPIARIWNFLSGVAMSGFYYAMFAVMYRDLKAVYMKDLGLVKSFAPK
jgi:hypothetical protein